MSDKAILSVVYWPPHDVASLGPPPPGQKIQVCVPAGPPYSDLKTFDWLNLGAAAYWPGVRRCAFLSYEVYTGACAVGTLYIGPFLAKQGAGPRH